MPELPEVETLRRELGRVLSRKTIKKAKVLGSKAVAPLSVAEFERQIKDKTISDVERRAKILIVNFIDSTALAFHLKLTGQLIYHPAKGRDIIGGHPAPEDEKKLPNDHTRLIFEFTDGSILYFNDQRKFGWAKLVDNSQLETLTGHIGVEPLSKLFTDQFLIDLFKRFPNRTIKQILLDQNLIAGIGNIYADESAFLAKLLPFHKASTLKPTQIKKLHEAIIEVLQLSIKMKGTSSRNYRRSNGEPGGFVPYLNVYDREGQPCKRCSGTVQKIRHASRGTHFCPKCQK